MYRPMTLLFVFATSLLPVGVAQDLPVRPVEWQPLKANLDRLLDALDYLGHPLPDDVGRSIREAREQVDATRLQQLLDPHVTFHVSINPEYRVSVTRGPGPTRLQQAGFLPFLVKVSNDATVARPLNISSPQAGPIYSGAALGILRRQDQTELADNENTNRQPRFLALEIFDKRPMTDRLSGLEVEYVIALIYCRDAGRRDATIGFDVGQGTQDLGFRAEVPVLFDSRPAVPVKLSIRDHDGSPTTARLVVRDAAGRIYPPQAKRLAPDFFFQPQVYRADQGLLLLPPGRFELTSSRGPEYLETQQQIDVRREQTNAIDIRLRRWVDPMAFGFYCGDHHIHGAGCSHYENPTLGVAPPDMFAQVQGEGLNVGCVLTWGPCFQHQRTYFSPVADATSEPLTVLKYDLEISGFGSAALGHVCLLNLQDQTYPGSEGTALLGWPTWTVPVMRWAKRQGGVTGYPHSALHVDGRAAAEWSLEFLDQNESGELSRAEAEAGLLPAAFAAIDGDGNQQLSLRELEQANDAAANQLPNLALPAMDGGGAMEIFVSTVEGVCDFISAMDTARIPEWNTWYHLMNCGFPLKLSGETDFPCMSSRRVGQGRVYVQMGAQEEIDFAHWCRLLARGCSYVSDGYAHALHFDVDGCRPGEGSCQLEQPGTIRVQTSVAFAPSQPAAVAYGTLMPSAGRRMVGDTVNLHAPRQTDRVERGRRLVEVVVNGQVADTAEVEADGEVHELAFEVPINASSWVAVRQFPQLHTNPVTVLVAGEPIRASRQSAIWCLEATKRLWRNRCRFIAPAERTTARQAYQRALQKFGSIASECDDSRLPIPSLELPAAL